MDTLAPNLADVFALAANTGKADPPAYWLEFPAVGSWLIYALIKDGVVVYIGKTNNLLGRLSYHRYNARKFDRVAYAHVEAGEARAVEKELIEILKPCLNTLHCRKDNRVKRGTRRKIPGHPKAWIARNGRYWKLSWRANSGGKRQKSLGSTSRVTEKEAVTNASKFLSPEAYQ